MLLCDFGNLEREIRRLEEGGAAALHLDVMDGHFVPNSTYGLLLVETCRRITDLPLDVHLMISNPAEYLTRYASAGSDAISFHAEAVTDPVPLLQSIKSQGVASGLAINPPTPLDGVISALPEADFVLIMSVMPGFGGQAFQPSALQKLSRLRNDFPSVRLLEVDGGVNLSTVADCAAAGADLLVAGSAVFGSADYAGNLARLTAQALSPRKSG
jgi:ribulose-phosphate 3-epimerase